MENKEKTLEQLEAARLKVQQYEHKIQLLLECLMISRKESKEIHYAV